MPKKVSGSQSDALVVVMIPFLPNYKVKHYGANGDEAKENKKNMVRGHSEIIDRATEDLASLTKQQKKGEWQSFENAIIYPEVTYLGAGNENKHSLQKAIEYFTKQSRNDKKALKNFAINISAHGTPREIGSLGNDNLPPDGMTGFATLFSGAIESLKLSNNTQLSIYFRTCNSALVNTKKKYTSDEFKKNLEDLKEELELKGEDSDYEDEIDLIKQKISYNKNVIRIEEEKAKYRLEIDSLKKDEDGKDKKKIKELESKIKNLDKEKQQLDAAETTYIGRFKKELDDSFPVKKVIGYNGYIGYRSNHKDKLVASAKKGKYEQDVVGAERVMVEIANGKVTLPQQQIEVEDEFPTLMTADEKFLEELIIKNINKYVEMLQFEDKKKKSLIIGTIVTAILTIGLKLYLDNKNEAEIEEQEDGEIDANKIARIIKNIEDKKDDSHFIRATEEDFGITKEKPSSRILLRDDGASKVNSSKDKYHR